MADIIFQDAPPKVAAYMLALISGIPGGAECGRCKRVNTYVHVSTAWKHIGGDVYGFQQKVRCEQCGFNFGYQWEQPIPGASPDKT